MISSGEASMTSGYARYLAAKTSVDDRALNGHVLAELRRLMPAGAPRVLEVGAGLGTMVARLMDWGVVGTGEYTLLDADRPLLDDSRRWLRDWAAARGLRSELLPDGLQVGDLRVRLVHAELGSHLEAAHGARADVLIANAVLDLWTCQPSFPDCCGCLCPAAPTGSRSTTTGRASSRPAISTMTRSCGLTTATWMSAFAMAGRPGKAGRAAICFTTCGLPGRPRWPPGRRTGSSTPARTGPTRATRLTFCGASWTRSTARCGIARIGWSRRTWPAGWPSAAGS